jgi:hypothetical protein
MRRIAITLVSIVFLGGLAGAQSPFPSLEPDSRAEVYARRGNYSWEDLAEIGLWASGAFADPERPPPFMDRIREAVGELGRAPDLPGDLRERGEYILTWMHGKFLTSYSLQQTRLDTLLSGGRYNCVSSAALYLILGTSAGLDIRGVMTKDHAFAAVYAGGEWIDVETTNPFGFDPGNRKEFHDQFGTVTGFAYVPAKNYRDRVFISPLELVSLIFSNRISELERRGRFDEAVPLAMSRAGLLSGGGRFSGEAAAPFFEDPRRDLLNRIFNFGASLLKAGKEEEALRWAALAGAKYPEGERWQEFILAAANNRMIRQIRAGGLAEARSSLSPLASMLNAENFRRLDMALTDAELLEGASGIKSPEEAEGILAAIDRAESRALLPPNRAGELRTFAIEKTASLLAAAPGRDWPRAVAYLEEAQKQYGPSPRLEQALRNYRSNWAAEFHNRFAAAWNRGNYGEAEQILEEGLGLFPGNRQLQADKAAVEKRGR